MRSENATGTSGRGEGLDGKLIAINVMFLGGCWGNWLAAYQMRYSSCIFKQVLEKN